MFQVEQNEKIGKYLGYLIGQQYESRRDFGRQYLIARGNADPSADEINNMSNRLMQIIKGNKAIQTYDLPYFTEMLGISCEQILSAGECSAPVAGRVTNYSIARRPADRVDCGLEGKLKTEDALRVKLIALASDRGDIQMLENLRAREIPQLYYRAHYLNAQHPDIDRYYDERTVRHIAKAREHVLDYFTEPFKIRDHVAYKDGSKRTHTFMFPYISKLLELLITSNSKFAETAIKKAIRHNQETYERLCDLIRSVKNDPQYAPDYMKEMLYETLERELEFFENGSIVMFRAVYSHATAKDCVDGIITNVPHVTKLPASSVLKHRVEELNKSYLKIKDIKAHLEEI